MTTEQSSAVENDPICSICGETKSAHLPTQNGPLTHPREARGEGKYVLVREGYTLGRGPALNDIEIEPLYRFEPIEQDEGDKSDVVQ
jgi:hypothetical protein